MIDLNNPKHAHADERLRSDFIVWFTTVRADGRPHSVPVWFLWNGSSFLICSHLDVKVRNLQHNANVVLALDDTKTGGDVITFEGKAELLHDVNLETEMSAFAEKYGAAIKSMGMTPEAMAADYSQRIRVTPTRFVGW